MVDPLRTPPPGLDPGPGPGPAPTPPTLALDAVTVRFEEQVALDAVSLEVADGEVVALLGPSGCGKTTMLRVIAGLQTPTAGRVRIDGADVAAVPPHRRGVGLMFQEYALFPHRDVGANVGFGLEVRHEPRAAVRERVAEVLDLVGLAGYERRAVGPLSGGERQRVALARALAPSPRVLMLDEPLGALDRSLRDRLVLDLQRIFGELGITVVYVTHDQTEALALADRLVVMDTGSIAQVGAPADVWGHPADASVARFLGLANVVDLVVRDGVARAPWGPLSLAAPLAEGHHQVVLRADAIRLEAVPAASVPAGPAAWDGPTGHVVARMFRGDRVLVRVAMVDAEVTIEATVAPDAAPPDHALVRVVVDPRGVTALQPTSS